MAFISVVLFMIDCQSIEYKEKSFVSGCCKMTMSRWNQSNDTHKCDGDPGRQYNNTKNSNLTQVTRSIDSCMRHLYLQLTIFST